MLYFFLFLRLNIAKDKDGRKKMEPSCTNRGDFGVTA